MKIQYGYFKMVLLPVTGTTASNGYDTKKMHKKSKTVNQNVGRG